MGLPLVVRCSANCQETILSLSGRGDPKPIQGTSLCHYISRSSRVDKLATSSAMSNFNTTLETNSYSRCRSQLFWTWWERQVPRPRDLRPPSHQVQFTSKSFKDDKNKLRVVLVLSGTVKPSAPELPVQLCSAATSQQNIQAIMGIGKFCRRKFRVKMFIMN